MVSAVVRVWHVDDGWGVLDSAETPGGCWAHFSHIEMDGYKSLETAQVVQLEWEAPGQDGFDFRAVQIVPLG